MEGEEGEIEVGVELLLVNGEVDDAGGSEAWSLVNAKIEEVD